MAPDLPNIDPDRLATAEDLARREFAQFQHVRGVDGRAECQDDWPTFRQMRLSQFLTWPGPLVASYRDDLVAAEHAGRNLIMEKYARMMESTDPERYAREIAAHLPPLASARVAVQEHVIAAQVAWAREFRAGFPRLGAAMRVLTTAEDSVDATSFETYLRGELCTYSARTLRLYAAWVDRLDAAGENVTALTVGWTVALAGLGSLEEAEASLAG